MLLQQAEFSFASSWLVPVQYPLGGFMLLLSVHVDRWLSGDGVEPNVPLLTQLFFVLNFLAADGWALTMLKRCNIGYASTCNSVGQIADYFLGYVVFIALESKDIYNSYLRDVPSDEGMVTLPRFLYFSGITFIVATTLVATTLVAITLVATTLVAIFKKENDVEDAHTDARYKEEHELNIHESYKVLWDIVHKRPVQILAAILLTIKVTFATSDAVTSLKLIDAGVPKEKLALLAICPLIPLQIILPRHCGQIHEWPATHGLVSESDTMAHCFGNGGHIDCLRNAISNLRWRGSLLLLCTARYQLRLLSSIFVFHVCGCHDLGSSCERHL